MAAAAKEAAAKTAYVCYLLHLQAAQHARTYVGITTNLARRIRQVRERKKEKTEGKSQWL